MKRNMFSVIVLTAGVLLLASSAMAVHPYYVNDLGTLGGAWSRAHDINSAGQIVGESIDASGNRVGFVWTPGGGAMQSVGSLDSSNDSVAWGINDSGTIVGGSYNAAGYWRGFVEPSGGSMTALGTLTGGVYSTAYGINNAGQIVGAADWYVNNPGRQYTPVRYAAGSTTPTDLGTLGGVLGWAYAINTAGNVAGASTTGSNYTHGFLYTSSMSDNGALPSALYSEAHGINDSNTVVGVADTSSNYTHAYVKTSSGSITDLGVLSGGFFSEARAVNNSGVIVGRSEISDQNFRGFVVYSGTTMVNLNTLLAPGSTQTVYDAMSINSNGQIAVGLGAPGDTERAGLLTPALGGDANANRIVDFADYLVLESNFGKTGMDWAQADFDQNGSVSFADYLILEANFGKSFPAPEPTSMILLASGALALIRRKR